MRWLLRRGAAIATSASATTMARPIRLPLCRRSEEATEEMFRELVRRAMTGSILRVIAGSIAQGITPRKPLCSVDLARVACYFAPGPITRHGVESRHEPGERQFLAGGDLLRVHGRLQHRLRRLPK